MRHDDVASDNDVAEQLVGGRYRLQSVLGEGGMGTVWRALDEVLHRDVAVKEVRAPAGLTTDQIQRMYTRMEREALSAARISARSVVTVHDVVTYDGRPWIVMEFVRGRSLAEVIRSEGTLPPQRSAHIGAEVLAALRAAYAAGVLHRDVKPANVLLGDDGRVVLTDFGIATLEGDTALTMTGEVVGTPEYLAPERALGQTPTLASDLWSLGALLYAAVQGQSPFRRTTPLSTLRAVVDDQLPPPHRAGPLASVIEGLMRKDPTERLSPEEAERELSAVAAGSAVPSAQTPTAVDGELPRPEAAFAETAREASVESGRTLKISRVSKAATDPRRATTPAGTPSESRPAEPRPVASSRGTAAELTVTTTTAAPAPGFPQASSATGTPTPPAIPARTTETAAEALAHAPMPTPDSAPVPARRPKRIPYLIGGALLVLALVGGGTAYVLGGNGDDGAGPKTGGAPKQDASAQQQPVSVSVKGSSTTFSGSCPAQDSSPRFTATFTVASLPFQFSYRWISTDGSVIDQEWRTLSFTEGGPRTQRESVQLSTWAKSGTLQSAMAVEIKSPFEATSNSVPFSLTCVSAASGG